MTQLLKDYLTVALSDSKDEARRLADAPHIRKLGYYDAEGKVQKVRELLLTGDIEGTNLIQAEVVATVVEGAQPQKAFMDVLPIDRTKGETLKWPYGETGVYAAKYAQGAEIAIRTQDYSAASYDASHIIAHRPLISDTMVEAGKVDVIEEEIKFAGAAVMNKAERICLSEILQDSGLEHDTKGANQGLKAVAAAATLVKGQSCKPDVVIMHPEAEGKCIQDLVIPQSPRADAVVGNSFIPDGYLGLKWRVSNVADDSSSYTWDYDTDGEIGMLVLDSRRAGGIYLPRDLTVKDYKDPIRDMTGMTVTMRMDCQSHITNATCRVTY